MKVCGSLLGEATCRGYTAHPGFTIIELLIVVVVIAVLAAITVVTYNGIQYRARASQASAALSDAGKKLEIYKIDNGAYPLSGNVASAGVIDSSVTYQYTSTGADDYCLTATVSTVSYYTSPSLTGGPKQGGCPGHGQNGVAAITNLVINPSYETSTTGVSGYYSSPILLDTTTAAYGSASASTTTNSAVNPQGLIATITASAALATTYTCSFSYSGTSGATVALAGRANTAGGAYIGEGYGNKSLTLSPSWQRDSITFTTPANTGVAMFQIKLPSPQAGVKIGVDGLICTTGTNIYNYADGGSANWVWNGAANASTSTGPAL